MKRFFRGVLTALLTILTVALLIASLFFGYLAVTGRAAIFGYTLSLIEVEEQTAFVLLQTDMPPLEYGDTVLHRDMDGALQRVTVSHASGAVVYYYDNSDTLCSIPLTGPEFAGKLIWEDTTLGGVFTAVSAEPTRWIILGGAGVLLIFSFALLILSAARRGRVMRRAEKEKRDALLLDTFTPEEITLEVEERPSGESGDQPAEPSPPKTYTQETATLDLNELRKRMSEENKEEKDDAD